MQLCSSGGDYASGGCHYPPLSCIALLMCESELEPRNHGSGGLCEKFKMAQFSDVYKSGRVALILPPYTGVTYMVHGVSPARHYPLPLAGRQRDRRQWKQEEDSIALYFYGRDFCAASTINPHRLQPHLPRLPHVPRSPRGGPAPSSTSSTSSTALGLSTHWVLQTCSTMMARAAATVLPYPSQYYGSIVVQLDGLAVSARPPQCKPSRSPRLAMADDDATVEDGTRSSAAPTQESSSS